MEQLGRHAADDTDAYGAEEDVHERAPRIRETRDNKFEVSVDGAHFIPVHPRLGKLMRFALSLQDRYDENPLAILDEFDKTVNIIKGINCHKTVLYARKEISRRHLLNIHVASEATRGYPEVISLANENPDNLMFFSGDVREYAREHAGEFPFSVHVMRQAGNEWIPSHSFLWLGVDAAGNEVCFQKRGPEPTMPFEIVTFSEAIAGYEDIASIYLILPVPPQD